MPESALCLAQGPEKAAERRAKEERRVKEKVLSKCLGKEKTKGLEHLKLRPLLPEDRDRPGSAPNRGAMSGASEGVLLTADPTLGTKVGGERPRGVPRVLFLVKVRMR